MTIPQAKSSKPSKLLTQVTSEDEKIFEKEEHQLIYKTFLGRLKKYKDSDKLKPGEKKNFSFIWDYGKEIFSYIDQGKTKPLSEENFCRLLLSVFEKIREKKLANKENLENYEIKRVIEGCLDEIRGTEAKDSLIKLVGLPFGIKIDPKNISDSLMSGLKEKIPFLGKDKKEKDEPPLSDEEMVTTFLRKSLFPIIALTTVILLGGLSGPVSVLGLFTIPHVIVIGFIVFGLAAAEYKAVKGLFFNDKKGTLYNPHSRDEKERKGWDNEISGGINKILKNKVKEIPEQISQGNGENKQHSASEQIFHPGNENPATLKQLTLEQPAKSTGQQPNKT
ncbi:hypothetical protein Wcon_00508 [Wolbachia endosymbiont of Cylisticus convexus]|uniref:hypothetical protein n=1 Tax=Wolbachia endosymbiont of Cylisticus convexus TaxID=118728 RepID=UPI000DF68BD8|nr:hypothetical protein [Wolbachia endosymbiont of Cylisticus convexus]RDD35326.1 hypothetical protein Wcon_00508 [Wolbachia endosymbiont of Cylisticus convexus]